MSKADRIRTQNTRQRIAAQQRAAHRTQTRRRTLIAGAGIGLVLALVVVIVVISISGSAPSAGSPAPVADPAVARSIATVPAVTYNHVGAGAASGLRAISGQPELTVTGKPELLYMGGEFCPFCAAERWAIAAAVSRFGTLTGLHFIHSSPTDFYMNTPTVSFHGTSYASQYLDFVPVEWYGEQPDPSTPFRHVYLEHPTAQQVALFGQFAANSIPFVDIGNRYLVPQTQVLPSDLANLSWAQVAAAMHDPSSTVGRQIDGAANMITAAVCQLTGEQPSDVCGSPGVIAARGSI